MKRLFKADGDQKIKQGMKDPVYKPIQNVAHRSVKQDRMEKAFEDMLGVSDAIPLHNERFWN
jgi:hypothetical protein